MLDAAQEVAQLLHVEDGLRDGELGPGLDLPLEALYLFVEVERAGVDADADAKGRGRAYRIVAEVEAVVEFADHVGQAD